MPAPRTASLPPDFELSDGMRIVLTALDASTGALVPGVTISNVSISVDPLTDTTDEPLEEFSDPGSPFYFGDVAA